MNASRACTRSRNQPCYLRFIKRGFVLDDCNTSTRSRPRDSYRAYTSSIVSKNFRALDFVADDSGTELKKKSRPSAAKASLRRAAVEAHILQHDASSSTIRPQHPTSGSKTVMAYCVAEQYDLAHVSRILRGQGYNLDPRRTKLSQHVIHTEVPISPEDQSLSNGRRATVHTGDIFVFPSGTLVAWDVGEEPITQLASTTLLPAAVNPHLDRLETEDLEYLEDVSRDTSSIKGDTIVLGTKARESHSELEYSRGTPLNGHRPTVHCVPASGQDVNTVFAKIAFSSGLARSTKLAVLESLLSDYFESTKSIPTMLSRGSGRPFTRSFVLRKTGQLLSIRAQLNLYSELTDSLPDIFWDSRHELGLERSYDQVGRALDVGVRIKTLNEKMDYSQEIASVLREQLSEQHGNRLEWIIIALITIEVGFEIRRIWKERTEPNH